MGNNDVDEATKEWIRLTNNLGDLPKGKGVVSRIRRRVWHWRANRIYRLYLNGRFD